MRNTKVVSISLPLEMLRWAESMAAEENRTMSELVREALRSFQRERQAWQGIFAYGQTNAKRLGVKSEDDVVRMVREYRRQKRNPRPQVRKTNAR